MGFYKLMCKTYTLHITAAAGGRRASPSAEDTVRPQAQTGTRAESLHGLLMELRRRGPLRPRTLADSSAGGAGRGSGLQESHQVRAGPQCPGHQGSRPRDPPAPTPPPPGLTPTPRGPQ